MLRRVSVSVLEFASVCVDGVCVSVICTDPAIQQQPSSIRVCEDITLEHSALNAVLCVLFIAFLATSTLVGDL